MARSAIAQYANADPSMVRVVDFTQQKVEKKLLPAMAYHGDLGMFKLAEMSSAAENRKGVMVHLIIPTHRNTSPVFMSYDVLKSTPMMYIPNDDL